MNIPEGLLFTHTSYICVLYLYGLCQDEDPEVDMSYQHKYKVVGHGYVYVQRHRQIFPLTLPGLYLQSSCFHGQIQLVSLYMHPVERYPLLYLSGL